MTSLAAVGAAGMAGRSTAAAPAKRDIIDVHAHYMPPELMAAAVPTPVMAGWSLQKHFDGMDEAGVSRSLLSITTPGVAATGSAGNKLIRSSNEYAASLVSKYPQRFGQFVYVKLDNIDDALKEIAYGLDVLKAHGIGLFTNYDDKWLGDPVFDPVFAELDARRAIVYVHPIAGPCCRGLIPTVADTVIEFGTDTTRAITSYVYRGAAARYPNVRMIWSHSGGSMPYLIERFDFADRSPATKAMAPAGFRAAAAKFYYDVAQASNPVATGALRKVVPTSQIVFGTDFPFRTPLEHVQQLEAGGVFNARELKALYRGNVVATLPQLLG